MNGVLIIDKPPGLTSHDVVNRVRRILGQRSVGHLGTLDPAATGVLPIVLGSMTRLAQFYLHAEKRYEGTIRFGFSTDTYDADGEPEGEIKAVSLTLEELRQAASQFVGRIQQVPPPFSAKKIGGVRAYKLARKNRAVSLPPVDIEVKEFEISEVDGSCARFRAHVGSGTYMRSIAHDLGQKIGCRAHLAWLRRTGSSEFSMDDAHSLEDLDRAARQGTVEQLFVHSRRLMPQFPSVTASEETAALIRHGRPVNLPELSKARLVKVFDGQSQLIAVATRVAGTLFHASIVFAESPAAPVGV